MTETYYGKYRGKVEDNNDPDHRGRLKVSCAGLLGKEKVWAEPCIPYAGNDVGFFAVPQKGANVWVEVEGGSSGRFIWSGCFWSTGEASSLASNPEIKIFKTKAATITFNETQSSTTRITIETANGSKITLGDSMIKIDSGKKATIELSSDKVSINGTALEVE